MNTDTK